MKKNTQSGFSLIELLLVVTIIGVIAAIGVPSLQKGIRAADNGAAFATLRGMTSTQLSFYTQNNRYARLGELNPTQPGGFGTMSCGGNCIVRGKFIYETSPVVPTDDELKNEYIIIAKEAVESGGVRYSFRVNQNGEIVQLTP
jgi:prepilin-type N-terminal cleavage/methylation domain-containing protein